MDVKLYISLRKFHDTLGSFYENIYGAINNIICIRPFFTDCIPEPESVSGSGIVKILLTSVYDFYPVPEAHFGLGIVYRCLYTTK